MQERVKSVDTLRAFALFGIAVTNMPFLAGQFGQLPNNGVLDTSVSFAVSLLFQGKFFLIFAFLLGWGFGIQEASAVRAGQPFAPRFARRQIGLLAIGALHATLVFAGDILMLYALVGLALFVVRTSTAAKLVGSAGWALIPAALAFAVLAVLAETTAIPAVIGPGYLGSFGQAVIQRVSELPTAFGWIAMFNGPLVFAAFCAGLAAARTDFLVPGHPAFARLSRRRWSLLAAGIVANIPFAMVANGQIVEPVGAILAFVSLSLAAPLLSVAYVVIVATWANQRAGIPGTAAGRMSLTAYIAEGVVGGLVFNGYGLALWGQLGAASVFAVAVAVFLVVDVLCGLWARFDLVGPFERVLRSITYAGKSVRASG